MAAGCNCDRAILTDGQSMNQRRPRLTGYALARWTEQVRIKSRRRTVRFPYFF